VEDLSLWKIPVRGRPPPALRAGTKIVSAWFLLYGLACVASAVLGGRILHATFAPHGSEAMAIDGGLGLAIAMSTGIILVGLGLFGVPHLWLALHQFRTGRFRAGCRGLSAVDTLLWVLLSTLAVHFQADPWVIAIAVGVTFIHGVVTIATIWGTHELPEVPGDSA